MPIIADVAAGPAILIFGLIVGGGLLLAIGMVEAIMLWLLKWGSFWRSLRDSLIVNGASALVGIVMYVLGTPREVYSGYDPARGGRIYEQFPPTIPPLLAALLAWGLSVAIEGGLLFLLAKRPAGQTWRAALAMNIVSYMGLGLLVVSSLL